MKIVTYLLGALLAAALGAAALFYFATFQPMLADYTRMKTGMTELDKAKSELKRCKEKEIRETGWVPSTVDALNSGLADEIKAGKAEVAAVGSGIVVNISEAILHTPLSVTFAGKETQILLQRLASLLASKDLKGKMIVISNTTDAVSVQGKGKKKIPPKDARTLAAERSLALVKFLEQNKVDQETLMAAGYAAKVPDTGFKIKDHKTVILIENPPMPTSPKQEAVQPKAAPAPKSAVTQTAPAAPQAAPKAIPLKPVPPKGQ